MNPRARDRPRQKDYRDYVQANPQQPFERSPAKHDFVRAGAKRPQSNYRPIPGNQDQVTAVIGYRSLEPTAPSCLYAETTPLEPDFPTSFRPGAGVCGSSDPPSDTWRCTRETSQAGSIAGSGFGSSLGGSTGRGGLSTFLRDLLKALPLKHQNPASEPPAKSDHTMVRAQDPYFSNPRRARSQKVRGQTMMT